MTYILIDFFSNLSINSKEKILAITSRVKWFVILLMASWTIFSVIYIVWSTIEIKKNIRELAVNQASMAYEKDVIYRRWNAMHGGVYVPVTEKTPPNPYLDVPERDIITPSGRQLTLINPAYMTRQVHEIAEMTSLIKGHITSLNPIRPANAPDQWEREALKTFENGAPEVSSLKILDDQTFMRFMKPLIVEKRCLKCHAKQGYKVDEIRGGISVSIPMQQFLTIEKSQIFNLIVSHSLLLIIGLLVIGISAYRLKVQSIKRWFTEKALKESEEKYRLLVNIANDAIFIIQDGVIKFSNPKTEEVFGYGAEELLKVPFIDLIHSEDREYFLENTKLSGRGDHTASTLCFRVMAHKDKELWVQANSVTILWEGHNADIVFLRDITPEKKLQTQLNQIQKMDAIGSLAGGIAHDFNNILMGIQGHTSLMLMMIDKNHAHYENLVDIGKLIKSSAGLTRQLLDFSRSTVFEVKPTDINELITRVTQMFGRTRKEIKINMLLKDDIPVVHVDEGQIEQVFLNLFVNACHAMPCGGRLTVETEKMLLTSEFVQPFKLDPGTYVKISVTDTGIGMDEATKQRIFEPFFTTRKKGQGSGLGLASVYSIVKSHHGIINVYSEKGKGTTFKIYLPAVEKNVEKQEKLENHPENILTGTGTILLVDDEEQIVKINAQLIETLGYTVIEAHSGKEAIELYRKNKDTIDIVFVDLIMPDMDGEKTVKELKAVNKNIKVILTSGYSINGFASKTMACSCDGFIQKPFTREAISHKLAEILNKGTEDN